MRKPKKGFYETMFFWVVWSTHVSLLMIGATTAGLILQSDNVSSAKHGTPIIAVLTARAGVPAFGVQQTTPTRSALTFKSKIEKKQNVQTAMKHIRHGQKTAWHSKQPLKAHHSQQ